LSLIRRLLAAVAIPSVSMHHIKIVIKYRLIRRFDAMVDSLYRLIDLTTNESKEYARELYDGLGEQLV
jgi:hypothetical protein